MRAYFLSKASNPQLPMNRLKQSLRLHYKMLQAPPMLKSQLLKAKSFRLHFSQDLRTMHFVQALKDLSVPQKILTRLLSFKPLPSMSQLDPVNLLKPLPMRWLAQLKATRALSQDWASDLLRQSLRRCQWTKSQSHLRQPLADKLPFKPIPSPERWLVFGLHSMKAKRQSDPLS